MMSTHTLPSAYEKTHRKKVLLIEDDEDITDLITYNLELEGYQVIQALSGLNALWELVGSGESVDCILLDLMMPSPNGFELFDYFKTTESFKNTPVVIVSAINNSQDVTRLLRQGAAAYLTKPFSLEDLKALVKRLTS